MIVPFLSRPAEAFGKPVCRFGLALHPSSALTGDDVLHAVERGIDFINWPGLADHTGGPDAVTDAVVSLGRAREPLVICAQFGSRSARESAEELPALLEALHTDHLDVVTFYYVESAEEWQQLSGPGGALEFCLAAKEEGRIRRIGITSHQRPLAAEIARTGLVDVLMIRYNAAHRGAERDVFPITDVLHVPIIAYTALRWGALLKPTPDDPPGCVVPSASDWYRFNLQSPSVTVTVCAPHDRTELEQNLDVLRASGPLSETEFAALAEHGDRVRRHAGQFQ